ncbi:MAG: hypothetical protein HLX46_02830 [Corynebacterium sp.]|uniref:phage portal protein family protein n=1 Tax=Corynebacterium sp. TaxID=1720 RepID=UPI0017DFEBA1|nr:hypothetical protein [Corynebacterium sp.]NWO15785.1 hypothetical protein [Corynebacterium sp.]
MSELGHKVVPKWSERKKDRSGDSAPWQTWQKRYSEMREFSSKVNQVESAYRRPIEQARWELEPNGAPGYIVDVVSSDLRLPIKGEDGQVPRHTGRVSFNEHLKQALDAVFTGVSFFEVVFEPRGGRERLRKLALRPNETIKKIHTAEDGGLVGITQNGLNGSDPVFIPVDRLVVYSFAKSGAAWHGRSILRPAWKHYLEVHKLESLQSLVFQRNGMGHAVYESSALSAPEHRQDELDAGEQMAKSVTSGESTGSAVPPGAKLTFQGVSGTLPNIATGIDYQNNQIAVACNATHLNLTGQGGSYGLAETQLGEFVNNLQSTAVWFADIFTQFVIERLVSEAFPEYSGPTPMLVVPTIQMNSAVNLAVIGDLASKGVLLNGPKLEGWVRSLLRIPKERSIKEALEAKKHRQEMEQELGVSLDEEDKPPVEDSGVSAWLRQFGHRVAHARFNKGEVMRDE